MCTYIVPESILHMLANKRQLTRNLIPLFNLLCPMQEPRSTNNLFNVYLINMKNSLHSPVARGKELRDGTLGEPLHLNKALLDSMGLGTKFRCLSL